MRESGQGKNAGRSIWAVVAGFLAVVILSIGTDAGLHAAGIFPGLGQRMSDGLFVLATIYRTIFGVVGSYITARLAPYKPMKHALIGGAIGMVLATIGALATWNKDLEARTGIQWRSSWGLCQPLGWEQGYYRWEPSE